MAAEQAQAGAQTTQERDATGLALIGTDAVSPDAVSPAARSSNPPAAIAS